MPNVPVARYFIARGANLLPNLYGLLRKRETTLSSEG